jgi:hypothetical protein
VPAIVGIGLIGLGWLALLGYQTPDFVLALASVSAFCF